MLAAGEGNAAVVECLLKHGAVLNARDDASMTPLMHAAENNRVAMVVQLLEAGATDEISTATTRETSQEDGPKSFQKRIESG